MRRIAALSGFLVLVGCAQGDEDGGNVVPVVDAEPEVVTIDSSAGDAQSDAETSAETATDAPEDAVDSTSADSGAETTADTEVDSFVADTAVADTGTLDTGVVDTGPVDAGLPWTHTISIDGTNDFTAASEKFSTTSTSAGYDAYVTWDATDIYVGYTGPDIGTGATASKWLFVYIDTDPGAATGALSAERYNTQAPRLPTGFGAEYYVRWRTDNLDTAIKQWDGSSWAFATSTVTKSRLGAYVEIKIPRAQVGGTTQLGLVTFMMNETALAEGTYAGLYSGNFVDGYSPSSAPTLLTKYLLIDTSSAPPNATSRIKP
jgi:hypothetical protein